MRLVRPASCDTTWLDGVVRSIAVGQKATTPVPVALTNRGFCWTVMLPPLPPVFENDSMPFLFFRDVMLRIALRGIFLRETRVLTLERRVRLMPSFDPVERREAFLP